MGRQERWRARYHEERPAWSPSTTIYRRLIGERLDAGSSVLDLGCGRSELLAPELAGVARAVGADPDLTSLARNRTVRHRVVATGERLPFRDRVFDLVALTWVLEHLDDPMSVFREVHRVLGDDGRVAFVTPNAWNYNAWLIRVVPNRLHAWFTARLYGRGAEDTFPTRYRSNDPRRVDRALGIAGFTAERMIFNGDPTYIALNRPLFRLGVAIERIYDLAPFRRARVHLIGVYRKS